MAFRQTEYGNVSHGRDVTEPTARLYFSICSMNYFPAANHDASFPHPSIF